MNEELWFTFLLNILTPMLNMTNYVVLEKQEKTRSGFESIQCKSILMETLKYTVIKNKTQYNKYCEIIDHLLEGEDLSSKKEQEIELLTVLIEKWDNEHKSFRDLNPVELIQSLMQDHNLSATKLAGIAGVSKSHMSEILSYKKGLSKDVIRKLATHFKMSQEAFNRPYSLKTSKAILVKKKAVPARRWTAVKNVKPGKPALTKNGR